VNGNDLLGFEGTISWDISTRNKWQSESIQMRFRGEGFVVVQPYEEVVF